MVTIDSKHNGYFYRDSVHVGILVANSLTFYTRRKCGPHMVVFTYVTQVLKMCSSKNFRVLSNSNKASRGGKWSTMAKAFVMVPLLQRYSKRIQNGTREKMAVPSLLPSPGFLFCRKQ